MRTLKLGTLAALGLLAALPVVSPAPAQADSTLKEIFTFANSSGDIARLDLSANTVTNLGNGTDAGQFLTNLAMTPTRTLYYMNPFEGQHTLWKADLNPTNTALINKTVVLGNLDTLLPPNPGIIDGFTFGKDGNLYMTGYGKSQIYRYDPVANTLVVAVNLVAPPAGGPAGEFRSDLAFDPVTGNLVGLGIEPGTSNRKLFEIPAATALTGLNANYTFAFFGGPASAWASKVLNDGSELGGNPDGIAFDPTNGDLYMSGDGEGVYSYNRTTAVRGPLLTGTDGMGWDMAFQTRTVDLGVPEPGTVALFVGMGVTGLLVRRRRK